VLHRITRVARVIEVERCAVNLLRPLFDATLIWMSNDQIALTGFERVDTTGDYTDYAQTWCASRLRSAASKFGRHMDSKPLMITDILDSEREMVLKGAERYGDYFNNALSFVGVLGTGMIKSVDHDRHLFVVFLSSVRKHLTLALFSTVRLHHVQAMMNLRQVLEAGACAAYAIVHTDLQDFADFDANGILDPSQALATKRYRWLKETFPPVSTAIKDAKDALNAISTHANVINATRTFEVRTDAGKFGTPFFDIENERWVKADLLLVGSIAITLMDAFYGINASLTPIKWHDDWLPKFRMLVAENTRLKREARAQMIQDGDPDRF